MGIKMRIHVEGKNISVKEGQSVLQAALDAGIYIPHLCSHPNLEAVSGCRLCCIEIEGEEEVLAACKTTVRDGMVVKVHTPRADKTRKMAMELILAAHPADCTGCPKYGNCELQSMYQYMGVGPQRWRKKSRIVPNDNSNPLIQHLFTRCVRCGRCVRACRELRGVKVLDFQKTKDGIHVGIDGNLSLKEAGCKFCGACIEVCPTGSIMDAVGIMSEDTSYKDMVVPCRGACPAGIDIPRYIRYIKEGDFAKAIAVVREKVPFPETLGSICNHICEDNCKRNELGEPISVCRLKRAAAVNDTKEWKAKVRKTPSTGKKVAVIGGGPAGLTASYYLVKKGHSVTVFEENERAGGQGRYGIPAYRLPDDILDKEIADILDEGVELLTNTKVESPKKLLADGYEAVLVAVGTHEGTKIPLEGSELEGISINTEFLKKARQGGPQKLGERVMILGGGNVAYDCARTAIRLGAKEVHVACLESLDKMPAGKEEMEEGKEEGIILHDAHSLLRIVGSAHVEGVELQRIKRFYFDENRRAVIDLLEESYELLPVDHVIFAVGQKPAGTIDMGLELLGGAYIIADENMKTNVEGIFAAGDVVTGTKTVIDAIAAGRKSAESIDRYLGGDGDICEQLIDMEIPNQYIGRCSGFADLKRKVPKRKEAKVRKQSFEIVEEAFDTETAKSEAGRCLQCDLRLTLEQPKLWTEY